MIYLQKIIWNKTYIKENKLSIFIDSLFYVTFSLKDSLINESLEPIIWTLFNPSGLNIYSTIVLKNILN